MAKIHCTVLRKNGTYKVVHVKLGLKEFRLEKHTYFITGYRYGKILGVIPWLSAFYIEGLSTPIDFDVDAELKKVKLKIDSRAIKTITNKKILDVFGEADFTRLEQLVILLTIASVIINIVTLSFIIQILDKLSSVIA